MSWLFQNFGDFVAGGNRSFGLNRTGILAGLLLAGWIALPGHAEEASPAAGPNKSSFSSTIEPIFRAHCYGCHQGAKQLGDYQMTDFAALLAGGESESPAIVVGKPDESHLIELITPVDGHAEMPRGESAPLSEIEIAQVRQWILDGAVDDRVAAVPAYDADNPPLYSRPPAITSLDFSPTEDLCAIAGFHEVLLLNSQNGERTGRLIGMSERINAVAFSPDGKRLAVAAGSPALQGELQVWDVATQALLLSVPVTFDTLTGVSWSPDGSQLAFACADTSIRAIDAATGKQVLYQSAHEDWVRDTVYSLDGSHLMSVGRDMTVKLTEVATERFVDNVTSITPGALAGGINSIDRHPSRDEILVGGADGAPKIYRVFRQTARKIGDDANLIRRLPNMPGRIFSVDISPDGTRLAAAATVDGVSEVRIWQYELNSDLPAEIKAIQAKRVANRTAEEKKKLQGFQSQEVAEVAKLAIPDAAVFAVAFDPQNRLGVASADGKVRILSAGDGAVEAMWEPAPLTPVDQVTPDTGFDVAKWVADAAAEKATTEFSDSNIESSGIDLKDVVRLHVTPEKITLDGSLAYNQLLVTGETKAGERIDVTRSCQLSLPDFVAVDAQGLMRPVSHGTGKLTVSLGDLTSEIDVTTSNLDSSEGYDFVRDVAPTLSRLGCNSGTCHGAQKGKNGFRLSLRGYDPLFDIRALADDLMGRRLNSVSADVSLMLQKPLGIVPHQGGVLMSVGDPYHTVLRRWIADGANLDLEGPRVERIELSPTKPVVEKIGASQQMRVVAFYTDGTTRDVTREAFIESGNTEIATSAGKALLTSLRRGEAPILARYEGAYAATTLTVMGERDGFEWKQPESWGKIDDLVATKWERLKLQPSELCTDAEYLRRVTLDLTGLPPTSDQVRAFLSDERPTREKREAIVDELIGSPAYVDYWTNKWADLLQVNRKFLGVEGAASFRDWIRTAVDENRPYDQFAKQILTASGSNHENPAAAYYKILREPEAILENTTQLFLGIRFNCNKCHDHPFEKWTQDQYYQTAAFFRGVGLKADPISKDRKVGGTAVEGAKPLYEEVFENTNGKVLHGRTGNPTEAVFPYETEYKAEDATTDRQRLAAWMVSSDNQYFTRSYVNRVWGYLTGVGVIEPVDDIRAGNPASNPELLQYLTEQMIANGYDTRKLMREICTSRTYQLSVKTNSWNDDDSQNYAHATPRRLPAEVLFDAVHKVTGAETQIPGVPKGTRASALPDSGVQLPDGFLANLGRPVRESACECERSTDLQLGPVMALVSGPTVGHAISDVNNDLATLVKDLPEDEALTEELFLRILGRMPNAIELAAFQTIREEVQTDHEQLTAKLAETEAWWVGERETREKQRLAAIADVENKIKERTVAIQYQRAQLEKEREQRIAVATKSLEEVQAATSDRIAAWIKEQSTATDWMPLQPVTLAASNKAVLRPQSDRSILAEGPKEKGTYTITVRSHLPKITGFRLEALPIPELKGGGPGFPDNGNFVVTEFQVTAAPLGKPGEAKPVKLVKSNADFSQGGFSPAAMLDGKTNDQGGWAVHPRGGTVHWATMQAEQPIENPEGTLLTFTIHQFHNAVDHRLAQFRLSATGDPGDIPLGLPESLSAVAMTPQAQRSESQLATVSQYYSKSDDTLQKAQAALGVAKAVVPEDSQVVALKQRLQVLQTETPDDLRLVQLRLDVQQSQTQLKNLRLTVAEDLTWALINSPAFLFNR